jgi:hypothetical protein
VNRFINASSPIYLTLGHLASPRCPHTPDTKRAQHPLDRARLPIKSSFGNGILIAEGPLRVVNPFDHSMGSRRTRHCGSCDLPYWCHARAIADGGRSEGEPGLRPRIGNEGFRAMQSCTFERDTAHGHSCQDSDWRVQTPVTVEFISNVFGGSRSFAGNLSASLKRPRKRELEPRLAALSTLARWRREAGWVIPRR